MQNLVLGILLLVLATLVAGAFLFDQFGPKLTSDPPPNLEVEEVDNTENRVVVAIGDQPPNPGAPTRRPTQDGSMDWIKDLVENQPGAVPTEELRTMDPRGTIKHVVRRGETLASLARNYLGDAELWQRIMDVNSTLTRPQDLREGQVILIPLREAR